MISSSNVKVSSDAPSSLNNESDELDRSTISLASGSPSRSIISQESTLPFDDDEFKEESSDQCDTECETVREGLGDSESIDLSDKKDLLDQNDVIKVTVLKSISSQLRSAIIQKTDSGEATSLAVSQIYIVVGTAHGVIFCFDKQQVMRWCLRRDGLTESVTSIAIRSDSSRLVSGYSKGSLSLWNLENGLLITLISGDNIRLASPLLLKFTSDPDLLVFSDTGGSVFQVWVRKRTKTLEPNCIFSGSRGEVLHLDALIIPSTLQHRFASLNDLAIIALATVTKVIVISLRPSTAVHFYHSLKNDPKAPPILNWKFVSIAISSKDRVLDPVLAFGRGEVFSIYQLSMKNARELSFIFLRRFNLSYTVINMEWFTAKIIAVLDKHQNLHIIDVRSGKEISSIDITPIQLTFSTEFFIGSQIEGQVSGAMAAVGSRACYNSLTCLTSVSSHLSPSQLLILGRELMVLYSLRPWDQRIDWFTSMGDFQTALNFAISLYTGEAKAVIGLFGDRLQRQSTVAEKTTALIDEYLSYSISSTDHLSYSLPMSFKELSSIVSSTIQACLIIGRLTSLWEIVYERCKTNSTTNSIFLKLLEPYIIKGDIQSIPPIIAKDLVTACDKKRSYDRLETIIIRLNIDCLDIHQVITLCRAHKLYEGLIYIYNEAFLDYSTPLEFMIKEISPKLLTGELLTKEDINLGNKILLYISCCLSGQKFHGGEIPEKIRCSVRQKTIKFIIRFKNPVDKEKSDGLLECTFYPNLKSLLLFDVKDFLNVLALAMEANDFDGVQGLSLTEVLIHVMTESCGFTPNQISSLFIFLARMVSKPRSYIKMSDELFNQIVESLTETSESGNSEEKQQALMDLVTSDKINQIMLDRILISAEKAKFYQVCEYIYWRRKEFSKIFACYLKDEFLKTQVFKLIDRVIKLNEDKVRFLKSIWENIGKLAEIDQNSTMHLIFEYFIRNHDLENLINSLESKPKDLLNVFNCLLNFDQLSSRFNSDPLIVKKCSVLFEPWIHEKYIELLCKYEPNQVARFLQSTSTYRLNVALQIVTKAANFQGKAVLLEKEGKLIDALELQLDELDSVLTCLELDPETDIVNGLVDKFTQQFDNLIQFSQRCSEKFVIPEDREFLWHPLLKRVICYHGMIERCWIEHYQATKDLCNRLFTSMMSYVNLLTLLTWILDSSISDDTQSIGHFSKIRYLLTEMLEVYNYETTLLLTYNNMIKHQIYQLLSTYVTIANQAYPVSVACFLCDRKFSADESLLVYQCHSYHVNCISEEDRESGCSFCNNQQNTIEKSDNSFVKRLKDSKCSKNLVNHDDKSILDSLYDEFIHDEPVVLNFGDDWQDKLKEWSKFSNYIKNDLIVDPSTVNKNQFPQIKQTSLELIPKGCRECN